VDLTAENTGIVLDSTSDFPDGPKRFPTWRLVPLYVRFGADSFRDYLELTPARFYERLRSTEELPTTSQPTPGDFAAAYDQLRGCGRIFSIHISGKLSGTVESARTAAADYGDRVRVIDVGTTSVAIAMLALAIQRRLERGTTDEEVDALVERFEREAGLLFTVGTLEYLARGGRIGRARAATGQLLQVKPILTIRDGEVVPLGRAHGNRKAMLELVRGLEKGSEDRPGLRIGLVHADAPDRLAELRGLVMHARPRAEIEVETALGAVLGAHGGPGTVGLFWFDDPA
jgi:DegV family protein with EDD domain